MQAEIICIGDELLNGLTINTNAVYIAQELTKIGLDVRWIVAVGDRADEIDSALKAAISRADIIILTGGLGPTHDDITRQTVATYFNRPMQFQDHFYKKVESLFRSRGIKLSPLNRVQAEIPQGATLIDNPIGTASGFSINEKGKTVFVLPGVPREMRMMMQSAVIPKLNQSGMKYRYLMKTIHTTGISESALNEKFSTFEKQFPNIRLASLPDSQGVSLRLMLRISDLAHEESFFNEAVSFVIDTIGQAAFGQDDDTLESVVSKLLIQKHLCLAVVESCTGGLISHRLTNIPGSSAYFIQGIVAYSNRIKTAVLQVPGSVIDSHGAVSAEAALAMAQGVRQISAADVGLSVTGIAGPTGGTKDKPVGLVFMGYADEKRSVVEKYIFTKDRKINKERSAAYALDMVRRQLRDNT